MCGEAHSHKDCPNRNKKKQKVQTVGGPHVADYRGCPAYKDQAFRQHVAQNQVSYASIVKQASPPPPPPPPPSPNNTFNFTAELIVSLVKNVVLSHNCVSKICLKNTYRQNTIFQNRQQKLLKNV